MAVAEFFTGDALEVVEKLCKDPQNIGKYRLLVTSPPYFGHRHYGTDANELGREKDSQIYIEKLAKIFTKSRELLTDDGTLWIVIGDSRRQGGKLMIPHRLALNLVEHGFIFKDDVIWYKKNFISGGASKNLSQAYEFVLCLSKGKDCYTNIDSIRTLGNEVREKKNKTPPANMIQYKSVKPNKAKISEIRKRINEAGSHTAFDKLPSTREISLAFGYDPEKYCPTCYRKFKRHATRKRIGDHKHYPIFAVCNPIGKNPGNVWEIPTKAHHGNEHFAIFPEDLVKTIVKFSTEKNDWVLDPFMGRGTSAIVCSLLERNFSGIELYQENVKLSKLNVELVSTQYSGMQADNKINLV
jgi:DNA modification methylase